MDLKRLIERLENLPDGLNSKGIPIPTLRDPKTGTGSVTLTMFFISFNIAMLTLIGKVTKFLGSVDYTSVLGLLIVTGGFYLGRRVSKTDRGFEVDGKSVSQDQKEESK